MAENTASGIAPSSKTRAEDVSAAHIENAVEPGEKWQLSRTGDGDTAIALFTSPRDLSEPIDPIEEKKLVRSIDARILPYLSVCYAFFYIDKTTLSYAAIFGIQTDLHLEGTQYSWLSSMFYFGFLVWAVPTNILMQRFPIGKYLGVNIFLWGVFLMLQAVSKVRSAANYIVTC